MAPSQSRQLPRLVMIVLAGSCLACEQDLPEITMIEHFRLIGARMQVVDDPERSTPMPGEKLTFTWQTAYPELADDDGDLFSMFVACTAPDRFTGIPICQEFLDAAVTEEGADIAAALGRDDLYSCDGLEGMKQRLGTVTVACVQGQPTTEVSVLQKFDGTEMLIRGVICQGGIPLIDPFDPVLFRCEGDSRSEIQFHSKIPISQQADDNNLNPSMADASFEIGALKAASRGWDPVVRQDLLDLPESDDCVGANVDGLQTVDSADQVIKISYDAGAREGQGQDREVIEFSVYATAGSLERRFSVFEADHQGPLESEIEWTPPSFEELDGGSQLVRFFFTVIDRRGGFDVAERAVCVTP